MAATEMEAQGDSMDARIRSLWLEVITVAWQDALGTPAADYKAAAGQSRAQARRWFERANGDFRDVCHLAGMDPDALRERYNTAAAALGVALQPRKGRAGYPRPGNRSRAPAAKKSKGALA